MGSTLGPKQWPACRSDTHPSEFLSLMTKKEPFFSFMAMKLGTCTFLMDYEQSVKWQFFEKNFRSNDHFSKKKTFSQMVFRSKDHFSKKKSVKWPSIFRKKLSVKWPFGEMTIFWKSSAKFFFGEMTFFVERRFGQMTIFWKKKIVHMTFRLNELSVKRCSVRRRFGQVNFRSNGIWSNGTQ
jgi:hypothetical protein